MNKLSIISEIRENIKLENELRSIALLRAAEAKGKEVISALKTTALNHAIEADKLYKTLVTLRNEMLTVVIGGEATTSKPKIIAVMKAMGPDLPIEEITTVKEDSTSFLADEIRDIEALRNVYLAYDIPESEEVKMERAIAKTGFYFGDRLDAIEARETESHETRLLENTPEDGELSDEIKQKYSDMLENRIQKGIRTLVKELIRKGQAAYMQLLKEDLLAKHSPERKVKALSIAEINTIKYWVDDMFNYDIFKGETSLDVEKLKAIHLHNIGKKDEAVAIIRGAFAEENWTNVQAEQFLFACMNKQAPNEEIRNLAISYIQEGMDKVKDGNKKKKDAEYRKGIKSAKNLLKAWFRTPFKEKDGSWKLSITDTKLNKILDECIVSIKATDEKAAA